MYPKVKVREEADEDDELVEVDRKRVSESLSINVSSSPGLLYLVKEEHREISQPFITRISHSYVANVAKPIKSTHQETVKDDEKDAKKIHENLQPNIRPSAVLRPRAVLSSPDNDVVIGDKNRIKAELPKALRDHDLIHNRHTHAQCRVNTSHTICKSHHHHMHKKFSHETADNKTGDLKGKKGPEASTSHGIYRSHHQIHMKSSHHAMDNSKSGDVKGKSRSETTVLNQRRSVGIVKSRRLK